MACGYFALRVVDFRECLGPAHQYETLAETIGDAAASAIANWMLGMSRYYLGEHAGAAANLQRARASYPPAMQSGDLIRFGCDMQVSALCYQAVTFWSLGFADQAIQAGRAAIKEARGVNHPVSLCLALASPSSILLVKIGDLEAAERCIDELIDHADKHSLVPHHAFGLCSKGSLMATRGDVVAAERWLRSGLKRTREVGYYLSMRSSLAIWRRFWHRSVASKRVLSKSTRRSVMRRSLSRCGACPRRYASRAISLQQSPDLAAAEDHFSRSLDWARGQQALSWELRTAMSLARLLRDQHRIVEARDLLASVYDQFTEGLGTADPRAAKSLLAQLT
jgi:tetratricopeptide (TPR) repeat protein